MKEPLHEEGPGESRQQPLRELGAALSCASGANGWVLPSYDRGIQPEAFILETLRAGDDGRIVERFLWKQLNAALLKEVP